MPRQVVNPCQQQKEKKKQSDNDDTLCMYMYLCKDINISYTDV